MSYCKRLIEVDLPIKRISANARREKSVGHISALHIWWARRPLAACRAVICATLWPDPADTACPQVFRDTAKGLMLEWTAHERQIKMSGDSLPRFEAARKNPKLFNDPVELRKALLDFIADFSNWDNATVKEYLETSRKLTQAAHEALSGCPGTRALVIDPFAGGGSIPLEALRVGADAFASDLNAIPVILNKVLLEYIPQYGERLSEEVRKWGDWIGREAEKELAKVYLKDADGATPIAYLWARTVKCEGPGCGAEIPIIRSSWLSKGRENNAFLEITGNRSKGHAAITIDVKTGSGKGITGDGTVRRGSVSCPVCKFTVSRQRVEAISNEGRLGERIIAVVLTKAGKTGRIFRAPRESDTKILSVVSKALADFEKNPLGELSFVPEEALPYLRSIFNVHVYGVKRWAQLFNSRQLLSAITFVKQVRRLNEKLRDQEKGLAHATITMLALAVDRQINALNRTCYWNPTGPKMQAGFARQAIPMFWDYCEANPFGGSVGSWESMVKCVSVSFETIDKPPGSGSATQSSATKHPLPDDCADAVVTDPPYYDAVPYADLSDFFYVWLKRMLKEIHPALFQTELSPKELEVVQLAERNPIYAYKTKENFENLMMVSLSEARRIAKPDSASVVVFAHQSTAGWEAMLSALINAGWIVTASWPIDTEMPTRVRAQNSAVLASSIHLLCRPREKADGSLNITDVGDWRDVLQELPRRIHDWMPRLAQEGVVGADAIFACLGPALEVFSKYSHVEKANGEKVELREYLEQVWGAVAKEALAMIFQGAHTEGFEEDARITAMWLWTLSTGGSENFPDGVEVDSEENDGNDEGSGDKAKPIGFNLEFDAARKISQGLGANLESLSSIIEVKGDKARLIAVSERVKTLFGKDSASTIATKKKKKESQLTMFEELGEEVEEQGWSLRDEKTSVGKTVLDKLHQAMILFGAGRADAMQRFLAEDGVGKDERFWRLAQALSALYPPTTDEKRWVDGVLARKKSLGF